MSLWCHLEKVQADHSTTCTKHFAHRCGEVGPESWSVSEVFINACNLIPDTHGMILINRKLLQRVEVKSTDRKPPQHDQTVILNWTAVFFKKWNYLCLGRLEGYTVGNWFLGRRCPSTPAFLNRWPSRRSVIGLSNPHPHSRPNKASSASS